MRGTIATVCFLVWILMAIGADAASYCAVFTWGKQCDYATFEGCRQAAGERGECERNPVEDKAAQGRAPYCLATPYETKCIFESAPACRMAASIENSEIIRQAECVANPNQ